MTETTPATTASLTADLRALGVPAGGVLLVHTSLRSLGWVVGGPVALLHALTNALGPSGTLVMPAFSADLSDPAQWQHPPVPEPWWPVIRDHWPAFDPALTPTREMGLLADTFRTAPGSQRSAHPQTSFAARGPLADAILHPHPLDCRLGEHSPLRRLYDHHAHVLLLGVGHANNTCLHLAEYRADYPGKQYVEDGAPIMVNGQRQWVTFTDLDLDESDFPQLGADLERDTSLVTLGPVAQATARLFPLPPVVDYAVNWFTTHRHSSAPTG